MVRAAVVHLAAAAAALTGCTHQRVDILGEPLPVECERDPETRHCVSWVIDRLLAELFVQRYDDAAIAAYVDGVGTRILRASGIARPWTFVVIDDAEVQGMAGFGTTVFVTRGALGVLRDEAELAGLLGHEIGHELADHMQENYDDLGRDTPDPPADQARKTRYQRDDEIQADELGVVLAARAGYDPGAFETMLRAVAVDAPNAGVDPTETHPPWAERVARVEAVARRYPAGERGGARYRAAMRSLIVGANPLRGAVVAHAAVFGSLGVAIDLPANGTAVLEAGHIAITVGGTAATLQLISERWPPPDRHDRDRAATTFVVPGHGAILFDVTGQGRDRVLRELRTALRPARSDEIAALHARRVDLDAPRVLWTP